MAFLCGFRSLAPKNHGTQLQALEWLANAHARAEGLLRSDLSDEERAKLEARIRKIVMRFGCSTDRIQFRNAALDDFSHLDWERMRIFNLDADPAGAPAHERSEFYSEVVESAFERFYAEDPSPPSVMLHITCTGYVSPSGLQRLIAKRGWGTETEAVHIYHMGCYASLPATRLARGLLADGKPSVDLIHTELCTLHLNPTEHKPEQLVVQTLFSDGMIRYSARPALAREDGPGLEVLAQREEIIPDTGAEMSWMASTHGMQMTLSREISEHVCRAIEGFLTRLAGKLRISFSDLKRESLFAIHPGGPRIIDQLQQLLELRPEQVEASNAILREYGNMSSATLPHIWKSLLENPAIPEGRWITSLAFGPGLTISGAIFRKARA